jgi:chromosome segregation ATPase
MLPSPKLSSSIEALNPKSLSSTIPSLSQSGANNNGTVLLPSMNNPLTSSIPAPSAASLPLSNSLQALNASFQSLNLPPGALASSLSASLTGNPGTMGGGGGLGVGPSVTNKTATFLSQLEVMMAAVKKEASALESMKIKLKEMEELKSRYNELKKKFSDKETENEEKAKKLAFYESNLIEMRSDMQKLNDLYTSNHGHLSTAQQRISSLETELTDIRNQKDFFFKETEKIPELKSAVKTLKIQLKSVNNTLEEVKKNFISAEEEWKKEKHRLEKSKDEVNSHIYLLSDEVEKYKQSLSFKIEETKEIQAVHTKEKEHSQLYKERASMIMEDLKVRYESKILKIKRIIPENSSLTIEIVKYQQQLSAKTEEVAELTSKLTILDEKTKNFRENSEKMLSSLQENTKELSHKCSTYLQEINNLKQKYIMKQNEAETLQNELLNLKNNLCNQEQTFTTREMELSNSLKGVSSQRDELSYKLTNITQQYENVSTQLKNETTKYWEELHKLKSSETSLIEENEKLSNELSTITVRLHHLETEKLSSQKQLETKTQDNNHIITALKEELEKRLNEIMGIRTEKDVLMEKEKELLVQNVTLKQEFQRLDTLMKKTLENERSQFQNTLQTEKNKIKNLEFSKHQLLEENENLEMKIIEIQKEIPILKGLNEEKIHQLEKHNDQVDLLKTQLLEKSKENSKFNEEIRNLKEKLTENHHYLQNELGKYDNIIKDNKKSHSQQILELNSQLSSLFKEIESYKTMLLTKDDSIMNLEKEKEKFFQENIKLSSKNNELNESFNAEINTLRKELYDYRNKQKISQESKTKLEKDVINFQMLINNLEVDLQKAIETNRNLENNHTNLQEKMKTLQTTNDNLSTNNTQLTCKLQEYESILSHKNNIIDNLNNNIINIEKDSLMEIKRLKLLSSSNDNEVNELRTTNSSLLKEINEYKTNLSKLQNNNNSTLNNILEEMKKTEDLLTKERKARQSENDSFYNKNREYEVNYELLQKNCHEISSTFKQDIHKLELKLSLIENDNDRYKNQLREKDLRIEEIENSAFSNRKKLLEMKERMDILENENIEMKNKLETEISLKKRLEARCKQLSEESYEQSTAVLSSSNYIPPRSRGVVGMGGMDSSSFFDDGTVGGSVATRPFSARGSGGGAAAGGNYGMMNGSGFKSPSPKNFNQGGGNDGRGGGRFDTNSSNHGNSMYGGNGSYSTSSLHHSSDPYLSSQNEMMVSSQSIPTLPLHTSSFNNGHNHPMSSNLTINSDITASTAPRHQQFSSPTRSSHPNQLQQPPSPAVDRVSAALSLKLAQQQRSFALPGGGGGGGGSDNKSIMSGNGSLSSYNSQSRSNARPLSASQQYQQNSVLSQQGRTPSFASSSIPEDRATGNSFARGVGSSSSYNDDILAADYDNASNNSEVGYSSSNIIYPSNYQQQGAGIRSNSNDSYEKEETTNNAIEESIKRTQMIINRKLGKGSVGGDSSSNLTHSTPLHHSSSSSSSSSHDLYGKAPNSGRSANKLHETIQQAHSLYPATSSSSSSGLPSPSQSFERERESGVNAIASSVIASANAALSHSYHNHNDDSDRHMSASSSSFMLDGDLSIPPVKPMSPVALEFDGGNNSNSSAVSAYDYFNVNSSTTSGKETSTGEKKKKGKKSSSKKNSGSGGGGVNNFDILPKIPKL